MFRQVKGRMKICLACSGGGHLSELMQLEDFYKKRQHYFVTFERPNSLDLAKQDKVYFVERPARNPIRFLINFIQSLKIFLKEKPGVVLSTGADAAIASCLIAKVFGRKVIFIESFCRVKTPSLSGRIMYRVADLFLVQWKENLKFFPKAKYAGGVF